MIAMFRQQYKFVVVAAVLYSYTVLCSFFVPVRAHASNFKYFAKDCTFAFAS